MATACVAKRQLFFCLESERSRGKKIQSAAEVTDWQIPLTDMLLAFLSFFFKQRRKYEAESITKS